MSDGRKTSWTPQRRAAQAKRMRARYRDPEARLRHGRAIAAGMARNPENAAKARARMKLLNFRMTWDEPLKARCVNGHRRAMRKPAARALMSAVMTDRMAKSPRLKETARQHCRRINRNPKVRRRQVKGWRKSVERKMARIFGAAA